MTSTTQEPPKMTLLIPTIGRVKYLEDIIRSINAQTISNFEILILDNACSDSDVNRFKLWAESDKRIRILNSPQRVTAFENFNRGIFAAQTPVIGFCHDDDFLGNEYVESHLHFYQNNPSVGFVGSNHTFIDDDGNIDQESSSITKDGNWKGKEYIETLMSSQYNPIIMQGISFRRSAFLNGFDSTISPHYGDFVVLMRIAEYWDVGYISKSLIYVRRHNLQASSSMSYINGEKKRHAVLAEYCCEYHERWPKENFRIFFLKQRLNITLVGSFTRGWLYANDETAANECVKSLQNLGVTGHIAALFLTGLKFIGISFKLRALLVDFIRNRRRRVKKHCNR